MVILLGKILVNTFLVTAVSVSTVEPGSAPATTETPRFQELAPDPELLLLDEKLPETDAATIEHLREKLSRWEAAYFWMRRNISAKYPVPAIPDPNNKGLKPRKNPAPGSVAASSDYDYFFNWVRDAAIVMNTIVTMYEREKDPGKKLGLYDLFWDYVSFSKKIQFVSALYREGVAKVNMDGTNYIDTDWNNPQDDGPALRALGLMRMARIMLKEGKPMETVHRLYDGNLRAESLIKTDLEYTEARYNDQSHDLWEEKRAHHFFTKAVQWAALHEGAKFARLMGDLDAAKPYEEAAKKAKKWVLSFWNVKDQFIHAYRDRTDKHYPHRLLGDRADVLDAAVLIGYVLLSPGNGMSSQTGDADDQFLSMTDSKLLATVERLESYFRNDFSFNQMGQLAYGLGRYVDDRYDGRYSKEKGGNSWLLIEFYMGYFYATAAKDFVKQGSISLNSINRKFFKSLVSQRIAFHWNDPKANRRELQKKAAEYIREINQSDRIDANSELFRVLIGTMKHKARQYEDLGYRFQNENGSLPEQHSKYAEDPEKKFGVQDLTWSCSAAILLIEANDAVQEPLREFN